MKNPRVWIVQYSTMEKGKPIDTAKTKKGSSAIVASFYIKTYGSYFYVSFQIACHKCRLTRHQETSIERCQSKPVREIIQIQQEK